MRLNLGWLGVFLLSMVLVVAAPAASFTASLDRDTLILGEQATLSLVFEGGQARNLPTPSAPGLQINQTGTSQSMSIVNGAMSSTIIVNFTVLPQRVGEFTIPSLTADVSGQRFTTTPLKLVVTKATAPSAAAVNSGSEVAFLKFSFPQNKLYVGQAEVGRLDLYVRDDVRGFDNFQFTGLPTDGFSTGKTIELPNQRRRVQVGNHVYTVIPLALPVVAVRSGSLTLGPFTASAVVMLPSQNDGGNLVFRMFNQGEPKQLALATDPVQVESLPLPAENRPANFNGAVGDFTMATTAGPVTLSVGDPITVRVQISGRGALDTITLPLQDAWRDFKTMPPTSTVTNLDQFGFQGIKTFEQFVMPLNSDVHELPALSFSFFNPADGQYHTLTEPPVPLVVHPAGATPMPVMAGNQTTAPENQPAQDILPIKQNPGPLVTKSSPLIAQPVFIAAQAVPLLAFLAAFIWRRRTDSLANNPRLRRQRAVAQLVRDGTQNLKTFAADNKSDEFFALLFHLLQEQLGERLDCPASAITESVLDDHAVLRGAPQPTRTALHDLFQFCNQARYAPVRGTAELNSVTARFEKIISELQEVKA